MLIFELCRILDYNIKDLSIDLIKFLVKAIMFEDIYTNPLSLNKIVGTFFIHYFKAYTIRKDF